MLLIIFHAIFLMHDLPLHLIDNKPCVGDFFVISYCAATKLFYFF